MRCSTLWADGTNRVDRIEVSTLESINRIYRKVSQSVQYILTTSYLCIHLYYSVGYVHSSALMQTWSCFNNLIFKDQLSLHDIQCSAYLAECRVSVQTSAQ